MVKCKLCGNEYANKRGLNCHMMAKHMDEYRKAGCKLESFIDGDASGDTVTNPKEKPSDDMCLRPLNMDVLSERNAYNYGYRFIDKNEELYSMQDYEELKGDK